MSEQVIWLKVQSLQMGCIFVITVTNMSDKHRSCILLAFIRRNLRNLDLYLKREQNSLGNIQTAFSSVQIRFTSSSLNIIPLICLRRCSPLPMTSLRHQHATVFKRLPSLGSSVSDSPLTRCEGHDFSVSGSKGTAMYLSGISSGE